MGIRTRVSHHRNFWTRLQDSLEKHPVSYLTGVVVCCVVVYIAAIPLPRVDGQLIGSDGLYYYSYLPTLLIDHDPGLTNQYAELTGKEPDAGAETEKLPGNSNKHAVGPAILWIPFFLIGHLLAMLLNAAGYPIALDGTATIYQAPVMIGSMLYGFAGVLLVYRSCSRLFSRSSSASAAILIWLATNLIYYMIAEPSMSHCCSFFASALFLNLWLRYRPLPGPRQWIFPGLAGGLVALVRLPDATWLALPVLDSLWAMRNDVKRHLKSQFKGFWIFGAAAAIVFTPQIAVWHALRGAYPNSGGYFHWFAPEMLNVLFSLKHGLYLWHPVLLLATCGLALLYRRDRPLTCLIALMFAAQVYLISAWYGWWGGDSFGSRMLISSFPAMALGLAALLDWAIEHNAFYVAGILSCSLVAWNALFFVQYLFGYIPKNDTITFSQLTLGKFTMLLDLANRIRTVMR